MMPPIAACQIPVVEGTEENAFRPGPILCSYVSTLFVISSTPKVAIPAARPESRISGRPTANAKIPPTTAASASDATLPTFVVRRKWASPGIVIRFWSSGTVSTPAVQAPTATKLTCPNDSTPELPMKT